VKKTRTLKIINPVMLLLVFYQGITGFLRNSMYEHFRTVHPVAGAVLITLALVHLALNWPWVKANYSGKRR
jgi:hypothetical protein